MAIRRGHLWAAAALLSVGLATTAAAQGYGEMLKGAAKDAAKQQAGDTAQQAVGGTPAAGDAAAPTDTMGRVNSAAGAGAGAAAAGAAGGNVKGAVMEGGKAAMDDWKKTGAAAVAGATPGAAPAAAPAAGDAEQ